VGDWVWPCGPSGKEEFDRIFFVTWAYNGMAHPSPTHICQIRVNWLQLNNFPHLPFPTSTFTVSSHLA